MKTDLQEVIKDLFKEVPNEKKEIALNRFIAIYNSYPSYRNIINTEEYHVKMDEKLTHAYDEAIREAKE